MYTNRLFLNDPTGLYTCLHFDQSGFQNVNMINHSSIFFSFWATFNSFVNARYSDISVDFNDFEAGFLINYRKI
jgi:hypothetical protein